VKTEKKPGEPLKHGSLPAVGKGIGLQNSLQLGEKVALTREAIERDVDQETTRRQLY